MPDSNSKIGCQFVGTCYNIGVAAFWQKDVMSVYQIWDADMHYELADYLKEQRESMAKATEVICKWIQF